MIRACPRRTVMSGTGKPAVHPKGRSANLSSIPNKVITIFAAVGETINGQSFISIRQPYASYILWSNGVNKWTAEDSLRSACGRRNC
jgi:hypothetical protein